MKEEQLNLFEEVEDTFDFESMKQKLVDNLDMLKKMTVQEQTLKEKAHSTMIARNQHELSRCLEVFNLIDLGEILVLNWLYNQIN